MTKEAVYVPKKGDIVCYHPSNDGITSLDEWVDESEIIMTIYPSGVGKEVKDIWLVGLSLARIEAEYAPKSEVIRLKKEVEKDIKHIRELHDALEKQEADRKERDEKIIAALIKLDRAEYDYDVEEMQEYYRKLFASVDSECQANVKKCLDSEEKK